MQSIHVKSNRYRELYSVRETRYEYYTKYRHKYSKYRIYGDYGGDIYIIYEYIDGDIKSYDNLYGKQTEHKEYIEDVAEIITQIQNIQNPVDKFGWYTVKDDTLTVSDEYDTMKGMVLSYLDYNFDQLSRQITQRYYDQIYEYISSHLEYDGHPVIGHCDIKYDNIIVSDKKWLIDWEFPRSIDPMYEYVKTERQLINQYNYYDEYEKSYNSELARNFKTTYFELSDREYDELNYKSYKLQEIIECYRACDNWFNEDEVPNVKSYYENQIDEILNE